MPTYRNGKSGEVIERIAYAPDVQDTGDKEAATRVISALAEASGLGNADYSHALTLAAPSDSRLVVNRIGTRLSFTIDSFNVATILNCRVYVDAQDANHLLFDTSHNAASNKLAAQSVNASTKATIFNLLKDGAAHTFYFFFWVNQATSATISVVELWEGVGDAGTVGNYPLFLTLTHEGFVWANMRIGRVGSGTPEANIAHQNNSGSVNNSYDSIADYSGHADYTGDRTTFTIAKTALYSGIHGSVATDLNYLIGCIYILRSES